MIADYVNDHPAEELAKLTPGATWAGRTATPTPTSTPGAGGHRADYTNPPFVNDIETNPGGGKLDCAALPPVEQGLGAHSAPLGLSFVDGGLPAPTPGRAGRRPRLVERVPPRAPEVSFFPWQDGGLGPQQTLVGGFQAARRLRWGRPVAAVAGPDGAVYVTDDEAGAVYRLAPPGR